MKKKNEKAPVIIASFNYKFKLTGVFRSIMDASEITNLQRQSIMKAANGGLISTNRLYWRIIPKDVLVDIDDLGKLTLFELDREAEITDRKIYVPSQFGKRNGIVSEMEYGRKKKYI